MFFFFLRHHEFSIKRRSAFAAHLRKHNIDITYVDIDAMALPLPSVVQVVSALKREPVQEAMVIGVMPQRSFEVQQARHMYSDGQYVLVGLLSNLNVVHI